MMMQRLNCSDLAAGNEQIPLNSLHLLSNVNNVHNSSCINSDSSQLAYEVFITLGTKLKIDEKAWDKSMQIGKRSFKRVVNDILHTDDMELVVNSEEPIRQVEEKEEDR